MPARKATGGQVDHVLNRSVGRMHLFREPGDFEAFQRVMIEAHRRHPIRILSYGILSSHWHFVVRPEADGQVTAFVRWLAHTHAMRRRVAHGTVGYGPLYRGRFRSFPVQSNEHLLTLLRYVERNALGAGLVARAEQWRRSGLWARMHGGDKPRAILSPWPVGHPVDWTDRVDAPLSAKELERLKESIDRGRPFGEDEWVRRMAGELGLEHTVRPEGRPAGPKN